MLMLIDCVGYPDKKMPEALLKMIKLSGTVQEIKANAFKSLHDLQSNKAIDLHDGDSPLRNNMFVVWLIYQGVQSK